MEDALISPEGMAILTGAGLIEAAEDNEIWVHKTIETKMPKDDGTSNKIADGKITVKAFEVKDANNKVITFETDNDHQVYAFLKDKNGNIITEPFSSATTGAGKITAGATFAIAESTKLAGIPSTAKLDDYTLFIDYYSKENSGVKQIDIAPDKFAGSYYIEASTLFRDQTTGRDDAAEFIIPNGKIQTNFNFTMAGTGDPSTFTFTVDAVRGRVYGSTTDVLAALQIVYPTNGDGTSERDATDHTEEAKN